ncbi:MAG: S-layer homology domain-containing protein [Firmicutes bacterium]|nr:S-layer homology domain-containing protein [Bacillota bacterium]
MKNILSIMLVVAVLFSAFTASATIKAQDYTNDDWYDAVPFGDGNDGGNNEGTGYYGDDAFNNVLFEDDFGSYGSGTIPSGTWARNNSEGRTTIAVDAAAVGLPDAALHGRVAEISKSAGASSDDYFRINYGSVTNPSGPIAPYYSVDDLRYVKAEFDILFLALPPNNVRVRFYDVIGVTSGTTTKADNFGIFYPGGTITFAGGKTKPYQPNTWYSLVYYFNFDSKTYTAYLNGELVADGAPTGSALDSCIVAYGVAMSGVTEPHKIYLDNAKFSVPDEFSFVNASFSPDYNDYNILDKTVEFKYNNKIDEVKSSDIKITKDGALFSDYTFEIDGDKIVIDFSSSLEFGTKYSIEIGVGIKNIFGFSPKQNAVISFTTMQPGLATKTPVFKDGGGGLITVMPDSGTIKADVDIYNPLDKKKEVVLALAVYNQQNTMVELSLERVMVNEGETVKASVQANAGHFAKAFVYEELSGRKTLLRQGYATLAKIFDDEKIQFDANICEAEIEVASLNEEELTIAGKISPPTYKTILIGVTDENGEIILLDPVYSDTDGAFSYNGNFPPQAIDGEYTVAISGRNISNNPKDTFIYLSKKTRDDFVDAVNSSTTLSKLIAVIEENKGILDAGDEYLNINMYNVLFEQKPFSGHGDLVNMIISAKTILDAVNQADWSSLSEVIRTDFAVLMYGSTGYSFYKRLSETEQRKINQKIKSAGESSTIAAFRKRFDDAVSSYMSPGGNGGGSGGGGGGSRYNVSIPVSGETTQDNDISHQSDSAFKDLESVLWAQESIEYLHAKGIVSGDGDKNYRPLDNITREEFIKLIVEAFQIGESLGGSTFTDVQEGAWYEKYLAIGQNLGIILGNADGSFGVGQFITRQDMATIAYRAVGTIGRNLKEIHEGVNFKDADKISDYAKEAVRNMQQAGIISGVGGNMLAPNEYANRAQAAKIIYNLLVNSI